MLPLASAYLFLLGLASGVVLLTLTAYRRVSPAWLKWLLIGCGVFMLSRYLTMALFTASDAPTRFWWLRRCWLASAVGLTLPSVFAVDQLIRHPAMSPKRLLRWCSPFLIAYGVILILGHATPAPDRVVGWLPRLSPPWQLMLSVTQGIFVVTFVGVCALLIRKIPSPPIRIALAGLIAAHSYLALDGLLLAFGGWYVRPFLYSELLTLLALWYAYETSAILRQSG